MKLLQTFWNKKYSLVFLLSVLLIYQLYKIKPEYLYSSDNLLKLIQAYSLLENNFQTESLYYPAKYLDPEYKLYPHFPPMKINGNFLGQYPMFLSLILAPLLKLFSFEILPYFFLGVCLLVGFLLVYFWDISKTTQLLLVLGTPFATSGFEVSEHPYLLLFQTLGLFFYIEKKEIPRFAFLSGIFLGLGVWLRLEVLFFNFFLFLFISIIRYNLNLFNYMNYEKSVLVGFVIVVVLFFGFNYWNYSHILGPRYLYNQEGFYRGIFEKLQQAIILLFGWNSKLGYFGYTPLFLLVVIWAFWKYKTLGELEKIFLLLILFFLLTVAFLAPNDGVVNWGSRYMNLALIPNVLLFDSLYKKLNSKKVNFFTILFIIYSTFITNFSWKVIKSSSKLLSNLQKEFSYCENNLRVFPFQLYAEYQGLDYFKYPSVVVSNLSEYEYLLTKLPNNLTLCIIEFTENNPTISYLNGIAYKEEDRQAVLEKFQREWKVIKEYKLFFNYILLVKK